MMYFVYGLIFMTFGYAMLAVHGDLREAFSGPLEANVKFILGVLVWPILVMMAIHRIVVTKTWKK